jgi:hypothetical protein
LLYEQIYDPWASEDDASSQGSDSDDDGAGHHGLDFLQMDSDSEDDEDNEDDSSSSDSDSEEEDEQDEGMSAHAAAQDVSAYGVLYAMTVRLVDIVLQPLTMVPNHRTRNLRSN